MSELPRAVQQQLDAAEALQAQLANPAPVEGTPASEVTPAEPAPQPVETAPQATQVTTPDVDWEQRFRVVEGKYRAELPRLHEQNRELSARLEQALKALEDQAKPKPQQDKLVTDAEVETFGSDLIDVTRRVAREEFSALADKLVAELDKRFGAVAETVQRTESVVAKSAEEKFWGEVLREHADFDAVNNDPRWFAFLDARVPGSRFTRRALAEDAIKAHDAVALNEQVRLYKESLAPVQPQTPAKPKPNLNAQVAPNTSSASAPAASEPTGRVWSGAEYAAALDHRNLQRMTREDYDALVAEAEQALAEGRVRF